MADHVKIEPLSGVLRMWTEKRDDSVHNTGIPYYSSATIRWINDHTIEIMGLTTKMTPSLWRAIKKECESLGINTVVYKRYKNGENIGKVISLRK